MPEKLRARSAAHAIGQGIGTLSRGARRTSPEQWTLFGLGIAASVFLGLVIGYFAFSGRSRIAAAEDDAKEARRQLVAAEAAVAAEKARAEMLWAQNEEAKTGWKNVKAAEDARRTAAAYANDAPDRGREGVLRAGGAESIVLGADLEALNELARAREANDETGMKLLLLSGRIMLVPSGTRALVIDTDGWVIVDYKVRLLDSVLAGRAGWVRREWIHRQ